MLWYKNTDLHANNALHYDTLLACRFVFSLYLFFFFELLFIISHHGLTEVVTSLPTRLKHSAHDQSSIPNECFAHVND